MAESNLLIAEQPPSEVAEERVQLGQRLVAEGKMSARDLDRALTAQRETGGLLGRVLVRLGLVSELDVVRALAAQMPASTAASRTSSGTRSGAA